MSSPFADMKREADFYRMQNAHETLIDAFRVVCPEDRANLSIDYLNAMVDRAVKDTSAGDLILDIARNLHDASETEVEQRVLSNWKALNQRLLN